MARPYAAASFAFFSLLAALAAAPAHAQLHEPNGLVIPRDSMNGETQLYTLFSSRGEGFDWIAGAHATPDVFSPLCGFTATFVLNQAGSHFGLAWYNATGGMPAPTDLHVILPAGAAVGTVVTSADIRSDPAYAGGLIGFALVGGQTHYTETNWNPVCTSCSPPAPWQMAVIYQSTTTVNAYYVAFEDGNVTGSSFSNDGDFNDDVFFVTGVTCSGGGAACDTGMMGVCAMGVQQCTDTGALACTPVIMASAETCNGLDDDCNGTTDDGAPCPTDFVCDHGMCVHGCNGSEFGCTPPLVCSATHFCVDPACETVDCPAGTVCHAGVCRAPCDGVTCPYGTVCRVDRCVDPCSGVTCPAGQTCDMGVCRGSCTCEPCAGSLTCDATSGLCSDPTCAGLSCGTGSHCAGGACVDDCTGAVCPPGSTCTAGACVPGDPCAAMPCTGGMVCMGGTCVDPCATVSCTAGMVCIAGTCVSDPCMSVSCTSGTHCSAGACVPDGTGGDGGSADGGRPRGHPVSSGGCCGVAGVRGGAGLAVLFALGLAGLVRRRRPRR